MTITYEDYIISQYIDQLKNYKESLAEWKNLGVKERIQEEIKTEEERVQEKIPEMSFDEQEEAICEFQEFVIKQVVKYFDALSEKCQRAYAIFENQLAKGGMKKSDLDRNEYPKVTEMNEVVNVLKHGKGNSYALLENAGSKYINVPTEILSVAPDMPPQIILDIFDSTQSGVLLNLEYADITSFLDEAILVWSKKLDANKAAREAGTEPTDE